MRVLHAVVACATWFGGRQLAAQSIPPKELALARQYTAWFYAGKVDSLWAHTADSTRQKMGSKETFRDILSEFMASVGTEVSVESERFVMTLGRREYWRVARFSQEADPALVRWGIDGEGWITVFSIDATTDAPPIDRPPSD